MYIYMLIQIHDIYKALDLPHSSFYFLLYCLPMHSVWPVKIQNRVHRIHAQH